MHCSGGLIIYIFTLPDYLKTMKRKIIKLGQATYVLSLPSKWIRQFDLKQGDYLEVEETERNLIAGPEKVLKKSSIQFDLRKGNSELLEAYLLTAYRQGYDQIEFLHEPAIAEYRAKNKRLKTTKFLQDLVNLNLIGTEIIEQSEQRTVVKDLGGATPENAEQVFQRTLYLLKALAADCLEALKKRDREVLASLEIRQKNIKKFLLYYERLINKKAISKEKAGPILQLISRLENISASYKRLAAEVLRTNTFYSPALLEILGRVNNSLQKLVSLCLEFNQGKCLEFLSEREELWDEIYQFKPRGIDHLAFLYLGPLLLNIKKAVEYRFSTEL